VTTSNTKYLQALNTSCRTPLQYPKFHNLFQSRHCARWIHSKTISLRTVSLISTSIY
jgi:hypothetical protein